VHELSLCQGLIDQVESLARVHSARAVTRIDVQIGPLSGIEIPLLKQAFIFARAGTVADNAALETESLPVRVHCKTCSAESEAAPNRLICGYCGDWHTELISGDEMLLTSVELELEEEHV
jgi:hydrogenase nickel incorporation protein HypA/HybF